ncbi:hypothetical protein DL765_008829 [Monosporascus sp. GIB2]|nr:hypothetical protein DL765_008829 [Monosporascus sp. GIB2]
MHCLVQYLPTYAVDLRSASAEPPILAESHVLQVRLQHDPPDRAAVREGLRQHRQARGEDAARRRYQGVGRHCDPGGRLGQPSALDPLLFESVVSIVASPLPPDAAARFELDLPRHPERTVRDYAFESDLSEPVTVEVLPKEILGPLDMFWR